MFVIEHFVPTISYNVFLVNQRQKQENIDA